FVDLSVDHDSGGESPPNRQFNKSSNQQIAGGRMRKRHTGFTLTAHLLSACRGHHQGPGDVTKEAVPQPVVAARAAAETAALERLLTDAAARPQEQILFGDLHVHTTFSPDAFLRSLPMLAGEGVHPPA